MACKTHFCTASSVFNTFTSCILPRTRRPQLLLPDRLSTTGSDQACIHYRKALSSISQFGPNVPHMDSFPSSTHVMPRVLSCAAHALPQMLYQCFCIPDNTLVDVSPAAGETSSSSLKVTRGCFVQADGRPLCIRICYESSLQMLRRNPTNHTSFILDFPLAKVVFQC